MCRVLYCVLRRVTCGTRAQSSFWRGLYSSMHAGGNDPCTGEPYLLRTSRLEVQSVVSAGPSLGNLQGALLNRAILGSPVLSGFNARKAMMRVSVAMRTSVAAGVQIARHTAIPAGGEAEEGLNSDAFPGLVELHLGEHCSMSRSFVLEEYFLRHPSVVRRLQRIHIGGEGLSSIRALLGGRSLHTVELDSTRVHDLSPLHDSTSLTCLSLRNSVHLLDCWTLGGCALLRSLDLHGCHRLETFEGLRLLTLLTSLDLTGTHICDLTVLEQCTALLSLDITSTFPVSLDGLQALRGLQHLWGPSRSMFPLHCITALGAIFELRSVELSYMRRGSLDSLSGHSNLEVVSLCGADVDSLLPLCSCTGLRCLDVSHTDVVSFEEVAECLGLQHVAAGCSSVTSIDGLEHCSLLLTLDLRHNTGLACIQALAGCSLLRRLNICRTDVSTLAPLSSCSRLVVLDASWTSIDSVSSLADLRHLHSLDISGTLVRQLAPLAGCASLRVIEFSVSGTSCSDLALLAPTHNELLVRIVPLNASRRQIAMLRSLFPTASFLG